MRTATTTLMMLTTIRTAMGTATPIPKDVLQAASMETPSVQESSKRQH